MGEYVRVMDSGDGGRIADSSNIGRWQVKTTNYTIKGSDGVIFTNLGATASVTFTLPRPIEGERFIFFRTQDFPLVIAASGSVGGVPVRIRSGVTPFTGTTLTGQTAGEYSSVEVVGSGAHWYIRGPLGTWTLV